MRISMGVCDKQLMLPEIWKTVVRSNMQNTVELC